MSRLLFYSLPEATFYLPDLKQCGINRDGWDPRSTQSFARSLPNWSNILKVETRVKNSYISCLRCQKNRGFNQFVLDILKWHPLCNKGTVFKNEYSM